MVEKTVIENRPYAGKDHIDTINDDTPVNRRGWAFEKPIKEPTPEEQEVLDTPDSQLTPEEVTYKKRYADLRRFSQEKENKHKKELDDLKSQLEATRKAPTMPDDELNQIEQEHPDAVRAITAITERRIKELEAKITKTEHDKDVETALRVLEKSHPDWEAIRASAEFHAWVEEQPEDVQNWVYNNETKGDLAAKAITMYKLEKGLSEKPKSRVSKVDASKLVDGSRQTDIPNQNPKVWTWTEIGKLSQRDYERLEPEIKKARVEGRITR